MAKKKFTPAIDLLLPSITIIKDNLVTYFILAVVPLLLYVYGFRGGSLNMDGSSIQSLGLLLSIIFYAPLAYTQTVSASGKIVTINQALARGISYFWRLIGLGILVGLLVVGGLLLFIVPGIIMLRRYFLASYYLIDQDLSIIQAMRASAKDSKSNPAAIYGVMGLMILFGLFGSISTVGAMVSITITFLYSVAPALRYQEFKGHRIIKA